MKFVITLFLILSVMFVAIDSRRARSRAHHRSHTVNNKFYEGLAGEAVGNSSLGVTCAASNTINPTATDAGTVKFVRIFSTDMKPWDKFKEFLTSAVNVVCLVKDLVSGLVNAFVQLLKRRMRRYIRRFLEGRTTRTFNYGFFGGIGQRIDNAISSASKAISDGVTSVVNGAKKALNTTVDYIGKKSAEITNAIKKCISSIFEKAMEVFMEIRTTVQDWFVSPVLNAAKKFFECLKNTLASNAKLLAVVVGILEKMVLILLFPLGWVRIAVGLLCAYDQFSAAIAFLKRAITEKAEETRWEMLGRFFGKLLYAVATS